MTKIDYQKEILNYYNEHIRKCSKFNPNGACYSELPNKSEGYFERGPEIAYVGEHYGKSGYPKILFTRLNPIKEEADGKFFFGSCKSLDEYLKQYPDADAKEIMHKYHKGWNSGYKNYIGLRRAGTVTGHSNQGEISDDKKPEYGIKIIMAGVFDGTNDSLLEYCAINNVIKCAGNRERSNPGSEMRKNCNYYQGELGILRPNIIIAFGNSADKYLRKLSLTFSSVNNIDVIQSNGYTCKYFKFPHPLGGGKNGWKGKGINERLFQSFPEYPKPIQDDLKLFKAGPEGKYTVALYNYTMFVIYKIAKPLKDNRNL